MCYILILLSIIIPRFTPFSYGIINRRHVTPTDPGLNPHPYWFRRAVVYRYYVMNVKGTKLAVVLHIDTHLQRGPQAPIGAD